MPLQTLISNLRRFHMQYSAQHGGAWRTRARGRGGPGHSRAHPPRKAGGRGPAAEQSIVRSTTAEIASSRACPPRKGRSVQARSPAASSRARRPHNVPAPLAFRAVCLIPRWHAIPRRRDSYRGRRARYGTRVNKLAIPRSLGV